MKRILFFFLVTFTSFLQSKSVLVIYSCPPKKEAIWNDGFVAAMRLLEKKYEVAYYNVYKKESHPNFQEYDVIFVKSNWNCGPDVFAKENIPKDIPKALLISGVTPPAEDSLDWYQVLFYETEWYRPYIEDHPNIIHAFGINSEVMHPPKEDIEKVYDWIMVGAFGPCKRHEMFLDKPGKKLAVGLIMNEKLPSIQLLKSKDIPVVDFVPYDELAKLYYQSKACYVPCIVNGGGERAVLEARACGLHVEIAPDNPNLASLIDSPIWDHHYYANQLEKGIQLLEHISRK